jgi:hypothetical protein
MAFVAKRRKNTWTLEHDETDNSDQKNHRINMKNSAKSEIPSNNNHK